MSDQPATNGFSRANFYLTAVGAGLTVLGVVTSFIFWISAISVNVSTGAVAQQALAGRVSTLETQVRSDQIEMTKMDRDEREVETQFCASDIVRNLMHANEMREMSVMWQKIFGSSYPTDNAYYPQICNRATTAQ